MFRKSNYKLGFLPSESSVDMSKYEKFHPMSYYFNGGIDLTGDALDKSAEIEFDSDDELAEMDVAGAMSVPYGDPRMSKFRLVENYGTHEAQKLASKSAKPVAQSTTETTGES